MQSSGGARPGVAQDLWGTSKVSGLTLSELAFLPHMLDPCVIVMRVLDLLSGVGPCPLVSALGVQLKSQGRLAEDAGAAASESVSVSQALVLCGPCGLVSVMALNPRP